MHRQRLLKGLAGLAVIGLLAAGCGDDDDDAGDDGATEAEAASAADASPGGDDELAAYCEAALAIETAPPPDVDFESATPEEMAEGLRAYATETMTPLADAVVAATPEEIADGVDVLAGAVEEMASTGDGAIFDRPDVAAASDTVHEFDIDNCGWTPVEVTAGDYSFDGIDGELAAGVTSFELTNDGAEMHELLLLRKNDGVTQGAEELLALSEEEAMALVTPVGEPAFAEPGDSGYVVADLTAGDYIAICFIPTGTVDPAGPPAEGPPHAMHGMSTEFTVS